MHKDDSNICEFCKHTKKRFGLRRRVNKANRANAKADLRETERDLRDFNERVADLEAEYEALHGLFGF